MVSASGSLVKLKNINYEKRPFRLAYLSVFLYLFIASAISRSWYVWLALYPAALAGTLFTVYSIEEARKRRKTRALERSGDLIFDLDIWKRDQQPAKREFSLARFFTRNRDYVFLRLPPYLSDRTGFRSAFAGDYVLLTLSEQGNSALLALRTPEENQYYSFANQGTTHKSINAAISADIGDLVENFCDCVIIQTIRDRKGGQGKAGRILYSGPYEIGELLSMTFSTYFPSKAHVSFANTDDMVWTIDEVRSQVEEKEYAAVILFVNNGISQIGSSIPYSQRMHLVHDFIRDLSEKRIKVVALSTDEQVLEESKTAGASMQFLVPFAPKDFVNEMALDLGWVSQNKGARTPAKPVLEQTPSDPESSPSAIEKKAEIEIPPEFRCGRCRLDMRKPAKNGGCSCCREHGNSGRKIPRAKVEGDHETGWDDADDRETIILD